MANNPYKRNMFTRKLPAYYGDTDAIDYLSLMGIKGLQIFDNPLAAEQNSSYSAKNVYQDDLGNLTVRPALRYVSGDYKSAAVNVRGIYESKSKGIFEWYSSKLSANETNKLLDINENCNPVFQEFEGNVYTLVTKPDGKLGFYKYDGTDWSEETGDIPLVDIDNPDISNYNILNNKVRNRKYYVIDPAPVVHDKSAFNIIASQTNAKVGTSTPQLVKYSYSSEAAVTVFLETTSTDKIYRAAVSLLENNSVEFITRYYELAKIPIAVFNADNYKNIYLKVNEGSCTIIVSYNDQNGSHIVRYNITFSDTVSKSQIDCTFNTAGSSPTPFALIGVSEKTIAVLLKTSADKYSCGTVEYTSVSSGLYTRVPSQLTQDNLTQLGFQCASDNIIVLTSGFYYYLYEYNTNIDEYGKQYNVASYKFYSSSLEIYQFNGTGPNDIVDTIAVYTDISSNFGIDTTTLNVSFNDLYSIAFISNNLNVLYSIDSSDGRKVRVGIYKDSEWYLYNTDYNYTEFDIPVVLMTSDFSYLFQYSDENFVATIRTPGFTDTIVERDTSEIPVITDISDFPVTTFFLDGFYWFVTRNHVFGTGAFEGKLTIKYFDPAKYFEITETITAAIRISDTSFWVFHNNGAYLIYKSSQTYNDSTIVNWLVTNTAKSKGCDFENAVITLPVSNYVAAVTSDDICTVQLQKYVQSDERVMIPMTMAIQDLISNLLNETESIVIGNYKYLTLFFLNNNSEDYTPLVVYDNATGYWWYWEMPIEKVYQAWTTEDNIKLLCKLKNQVRVLRLTTDLYSYNTNLIAYDIYADIIPDKTNAIQLSQIKWYWESAMLMFKSLNFRKQLILTTFGFSDISNRVNGELQDNAMNFVYKFEIYAKRESDKGTFTQETEVTRAKNNTYRTSISNFIYLQIVLRNQDADDTYLYELLKVMTRPKLTSITFKYRTLPGGPLC